jgi:RNA polymerase sigma-70 factor (ECF subfamily)
LPRNDPCRDEPNDERSDRELVAGIRRGSQPDFNRLYDRYFQRVYGFAYQRLHDHADTEEVVQETFIAVFRCVEAYRGQSSLLSWIYGIAKNTVNNHIRRSKAHEQRIERAEFELMRPATSLYSSTPEEQLSLTRCEDAIRSTLASVASWQAEVFVLRHVENLSIGEISRRVSRSNDAVRSSLYRVKKQLVEAVDGTLVHAA